MWRILYGLRRYTSLGRAPRPAPQRAGTTPELREPPPALERDPTHPVRFRVDEELTVEVRAVEPAAAPKRSAADALGSGARLGRVAPKKNHTLGFATPLVARERAWPLDSSRDGLWWAPRWNGRACEE